MRRDEIRQGVDFLTQRVAQIPRSLVRLFGAAEQIRPRHIGDE